MSIECAFFGALGRDAERKVSSAGKTYLHLNVRVGDGDSAHWISTMVFDQDAIAAAEKLTKGARVYVEGRLSVNEWAGQDGAKRHGLSVMSWHRRLSAIGRNRPRKQKQDFPRDMRAPLAGRASGFDDDVPFAAEAR
jgi:single-stranded DNA-binding protein